MVKTDFCLWMLSLGDTNRNTENYQVIVFPALRTLQPQDRNKTEMVA